MSYRLLPLVWRAAMDAADKIVLLRLVDHAHDDGSCVRPGVPSIAVACGCGERRVQEALKRFRDSGLLILVREANPATKEPREYRIDVQRLSLLEEEGDRCTIFTGAPHAPVHDMREPVHHVRGTGAPRAPKSLEEPLVESSREREAASSRPAIGEGRVLSLHDGLPVEGDGATVVALPVLERQKDAGKANPAPRDKRLYLAANGCTIESYQPDHVRMGGWAAEKCPLVPNPVHPDTVDEIKDVWRRNGVKPKDFDATYRDYLRKRQRWGAEKQQGNSLANDKLLPATVPQCDEFGLPTKSAAQVASETRELYRRLGVDRL